MFCFFNDTATTENYTYLHTLSLHDALPISGILRSLDYAASTAILNRSADQPQTLQTMALQVEEWQRLAAEAFLKGYNRSEEHTSELQSLMRISYAVFCLTKKKIYTITN